jgi:4'-phosphopantetheinyl transferase
MSLPADAQLDRFFDLWTLKEALIKADGGGLSIPLDRFSFSFDADRSIRVTFAPDFAQAGPGWKFWLFEATQDHKVALAIKGLTGLEQYSVSVREIVPLMHVVDAGWTVLGRSQPETT